MKIKMLKEDEIVVNKKELIYLLSQVRSACQNASHALIWFEAKNPRQQELRDDYCRILSNRADDINEYLSGLD